MADRLGIGRKEFNVPSPRSEVGGIRLSPASASMATGRVGGRGRFRRLTLALGDGDGAARHPYPDEGGAATPPYRRVSQGMSRYVQVNSVN